MPDGGFIEAHTDLVQKLDYECELAVVLGKDAKDVPAGQTKDYVFGYTILNDVSARDVQTAHKQWYFGKSLDGFTPMGPCIVTADEFDTYPPALPIRSRVNGELRQDSNTKLQIFDIDHVIHELSQGMTLKAGTIIATGTPAGVGMGFDPPKVFKSRGRGPLRDRRHRGCWRIRWSEGGPTGGGIGRSYPLDRRRLNPAPWSPPLSGAGIQAFSKRKPGRKESQGGESFSPPWTHLSLV